MLGSVSRAFEIALATLAITLLLVLASIVVLAVAFRYSGNSLIWYDEIAEVLLAWVSFIGAGYACLKRAHLGTATLVLALPRPARFALFCATEAIVIAIFAAVAVYGALILGVMGSETLVAVRWLPLSVTQSSVPIGAVLIILAQLISAPAAWARLAAGVSHEQAEIEAEIDRARRSLADDAGPRR